MTSINEFTWNEKAVKAVGDWLFTLMTIGHSISAERVGIVGKVSASVIGAKQATEFFQRAVHS
jgi:hypothetical protein